jgi:predicted transcriptional regulator
MHTADAEHHCNTRICTQTAQSLMTSPVKTAYEGWSVKMLMDFFIRNSISGAPVIAGDGELVGVVTLSDVVKFENMTLREKETLARASWYGEYTGLELTEDELRRLLQNADSNCTVNQIMTPQVIQVELSTSLLDIATLMRDRHIHRVFVSDNKKVVGVVSTTSILNGLITHCGC